MLWFGIKKEVARLTEEVKQLKCCHPTEKNIFTEERYYVWTHRERKCSNCGAVLESFGSDLAMQRAKGEWHKKEAGRLDIDKLLGAEANIAGSPLDGGTLYTYTNIGTVVCDGDFIKKTKGRYVHVKSGKVLKVKK